jgi:hypothetical protein
MPLLWALICNIAALLFWYSCPVVIKQLRRVLSAPVNFCRCLPYSTWKAIFMFVIQLFFSSAWNISFSSFNSSFGEKIKIVTSHLKLSQNNTVPQAQQYYFLSFVLNEIRLNEFTLTKITLSNLLVFRV